MTSEVASQIFYLTLRPVSQSCLVWLCLILSVILFILWLRKCPRSVIDKNVVYPPTLPPAKVSQFHTHHQKTNESSSKRMESKVNQNHWRLLNAINVGQSAAKMKMAKITANYDNMNSMGLAFLDLGSDFGTYKRYVLYLCPTGPLQKDLMKFWELSKKQCGWNGVHNSIPHIPLCLTFVCSNHDFLLLTECVKSVTSSFQQYFHGENIAFKKIINDSYLGLSAGRKDNFLLSSLFQALAKEILLCTGISIEPAPSEFHLTLAFNFEPQHLDLLKSLVDSIDITLPCNWYLRLYSTNVRVEGKLLFTIMYDRKSEEKDWAKLTHDDLVIVRPDDLETSKDGRVIGTSYNTGEHNIFPISHLKLTPETDTWILHQDIPLTDSKLSHFDPSQAESVAAPKVTQGAVTMTELSSSPVVSDQSDLMPLRASQETPDRSESTIEGKGKLLNEACKGPNRKVFVCRHGERIDFTFGGTWIPNCFDENGQYTQKDLNLPTSLPRRVQGPFGYYQDCPLTMLGVIQARLLGEALASSGVTVAYAFTSPAFRCVQTCYSILKGMGRQRDVKLKIEPGLFEWLMLHENSIPQCLTHKELLDAGYNVDIDHKPYVSFNELQNVQESCDDFYVRNFYVSQSIVKDCPVGNILVVGHAASLETCTRQMIGLAPRSTIDIMDLIRKIPYCGLVVMEEVPVADSKGKETKWQLTEPPIPTMTHCSNANFDWNVLQ